MMLNLLTFSLCQVLDSGHGLKLYKPQVHLDIRKIFFTVRVIDEWNRLPESLLHCGTLSTFKKRLDCYFKNRGYD